MTELIDSVRDFAESTLRSQAGTFDRDQALPRTIIQQLAERKLLLASLPEDKGGLGLDPFTYGMVTEVLAKACCSTVSLLTVQSSLIGESLLKWGSPALQDVWLPRLAAGHLAAFALSEPEIGSNARGVKTHYRADGDGFRLNGQKKWISFGAVADVFLVIASSGEEQTAFWIEATMPGVTVTPMHGLLGRRATHLAEIDFEDVYVPATQIIGKQGTGFTYVTNTALDHGRFSVAWSGLGVAQAALDAMVSYSRQRRQFDQRLSEFQLVQGMIADATVQVHAARALCERAATYRAQGHADAIIETTLAKQFCARVAMDVAQTAVQVHGGNGCSSDYPVERLFREAKVFDIVEGTGQILQQVIARFALRRYKQSG
jgi:alkylation response protein AidB-like acyl-CoA dehydrogenase